MFKSHAILEEKSRKLKAQKIIAVIKEHKRLEKSSILDIGCGSGHIGSILSKKAKNFVACDLIDERVIKDFKFIKADASNLPFEKDSFDIIICNHIIEHVKSEKLAEELFRLLKKDGICYIATPNKLWPVEPHYRLPLLSLLPKWMADIYVRAFKKGEKYDVCLFTYWELKRLFNKFIIYNLTTELMKEPDKYYLINSFTKYAKIFRKAPNFIINTLNLISPTYIFVLKKKKSGLLWKS